MRKIKANALYVVVVIALIAASMCSGLILLAYYLRLELVGHDLSNRLLLNAASGVNVLLASPSGIVQGERIQDLYQEGTDSVVLSSARWGVFEVGSVKAIAKGRSVSRSLLFGYKPSGNTTATLYMADHNRPLTVGGNTILKGKCFLPEAGTKRGYFEGRSFSGQKVVDGEVQKSTSTMTAVDANTLEHLREMLSGSIKPTFRRIAFSDLDSNTIIRSFSDSTLHIHSVSPVQLTGTYKGNIIIHSNAFVSVTAAAQLHDVVIAAPYVHIQHGFKGNVQIFATDSIIVEPACRFFYPSVLGLVKAKDAPFAGVLKIDEGVSLSGQVFALQEQTDGKRSLMSIGKQSVIEGQVYAQGYLELKGKVYGHTSCNAFFLRTLSSMYENHLLDAELNAEKCDPAYIGSALLPGEDKKRLVKWLN